MDARKQLRQIFSYVKALVERKCDISLSYTDYPFNLELFNLPKHPLIKRIEAGEEALGETTAVLSVGKPIVEPCPALPPVLYGWVEDGWDDPLKTVTVKEKREFCDDAESDEIRTELFSDDTARRDVLTLWMEGRDAWRYEAEPATRARMVYDKLYDLWSQMSREKDRMELVIGDGMLVCDLGDGIKIHHPLVLERVTLEFDAQKPMFTICDCDTPSTLNTRLLRILPNIETQTLSGLANELEDSGIHAFDTAPLDDYLTKLCNTISPDIEFEQEGKKYTIIRETVLFTRSRNSGYIAMTEKILDDIEITEEFSPSLLSILGEGVYTETEHREQSIAEKLISVNGIDPDFLLEKQANKEQLLIARKINENPAVIVQGPPGTGKTHTISNIIGDLLSRGQSVLVTSQTSKALSVLRDKISEPIRPLCVSISDDNQKQLENSLNTINDYMSAYNAETLDEEAEHYEQERRKVIADLVNARSSLVNLVKKEYEEIEVDGKYYTPKQAAELICDRQDEAFIPDSVGLGTPMPLSEEELKTLYNSNIALSELDEKILTIGAPDSSQLLDSMRFKACCEVADGNGETIKTEGVGYWKDNSHRDTAMVGEVYKRLRIEADRLSRAEGWQLSLAQAGISEGGVTGVFASIDKQLPELNRLYAEIRGDIIDTDPQIPDELITPEVTPIFADMLEDIEGEKINWLKIMLNPKWKPVLERCIINGEKPDTRSEVVILSNYHAYLLGKKQLLNRWEKAVRSVGGPDITAAARPEEAAQKIWSSVTDWLTWYADSWQGIQTSLEELGFDFARYSETIPMQTRMLGEVESICYALKTDLLSYVQLEFTRGDRTDCLETLRNAANTLVPYERDFAPMITEMRVAIENRDTEGYNEALHRYERVCAKREAYKTRCELIVKLSEICPLWAQEIAGRRGANGGGTIPADYKLHWIRAQLRGELEVRLGKSVEDIQERIAELTKSYSVVTRELITRRAWSAELRTMRDPSRKAALATWATLVKRVGKGTGKRAEQLLASGELRRAMKACRRSVPVWIMPLPSVAEYFEPGDEKFDVLIIDEASQADLSGLIGLYIAKKVIVVGDDKQVSPTPVGMDLETSQKLHAEFLTGVKNASMYDELVSIYDLGKANYEPITLREHFRCATDIINFSNYYTYNGLICPLRDSGSITVKPAMVEYRVEDGAPSGKKTNKNEANAIVSLICACMKQPEYKGLTFGVITMIGDEQGVLIDRMLRERITESEYRERQILCGNPAYFQGDERDVIFISLVDAGKGDGSTLQVRREGYNDVYAKRYNVAASRAKDQLWVVHSLDPNVDLKGDDIRLKLISHAADPEATAKALEKVTPAAVSYMEKELSNALIAEGYDVTFREKVGTYIVPMICSGSGKRAAIECDGETPMTDEEISVAMSRQSVLERLGWKFIRVRASSYYQDKDACAKELLKRIKALGIKPGKKDKTADNALIDRVCQCAEELRQQWSTPDTTEAEAE